VALYGPFVLLFEIIPSVESTSGTEFAACIVVYHNNFSGRY